MWCIFDIYIYICSLYLGWDISYDENGWTPKRQKTYAAYYTSPHGNSYPGDHLTDGISIAAQIQYKFCFAFILILTNWSLHNLAHEWAWQLCCHGMCKNVCDVMVSNWITATWHYHRIWTYKKSLVKGDHGRGIGAWLSGGWSLGSSEGYSFASRNQMSNELHFP